MLLAGLCNNRVHIWYVDAVDYLNHRPFYWITHEGRWFSYLLFPLLKRLDGSITLYLNLLCLFAFAYTAARRYIGDSAYALAFASLCMVASPWVHQLTWPSTTLPATVMLVVAALSVRALPIYVFYALFGSLFVGSIQNLYYLLPLLHLPLLDGTTFVSNVRTLATRVVPSWIVGFLAGNCLMLAVVYCSTYLETGIGQMGLTIQEWRQAHPRPPASSLLGVENLDYLVANTLSSIGDLVEHVKILLFLDTPFAWLVIQGNRI